VQKLPAAADLANVDRVELIAVRKPAGANGVLRRAAAFLHRGTPRRLDTPALPKGPLLDAMGQFRLADWPAKARDVNDVSARLHAGLAAASEGSVARPILTLWR
jgi:hypothetical protein